MREIVRLGFTLMVICAVAAAALAITHAQTTPIIEERQAQALQENLRTLLPNADHFELESDENEETQQFYLGYKGNDVVGAAALFTAGGYGGDIRMMVGLDNNGKITGLKVMEHTETAGLGAKIEEDWFQDQFVGKTTADPFTIGEDIDGITGATISSRSVAGGVKLVITEIEETLLGGAAPSIDLAQVPDGTYSGTSQSFGGPMEVEVTVAGGKITAIEVLSHSDTAGVSDAAIEKVPQRIIEEQSLAVDGVSGATFSSVGVMDAVKAALAGANE